MSVVLVLRRTGGVTNQRFNYFVLIIFKRIPHSPEVDQSKLIVL